MKPATRDAADDDGKSRWATRRAAMAGIGLACLGVSAAAAPRDRKTSFLEGRMEALRIAREIAVPLAAAWSIVGDFGGVQRWIPELRCTVVGSGIGSIRSITYPDGRVVAERLEALDPSRKLVRYSMVSGSILPLHDILSTFQLTQGGSDGWTVVEFAMSAKQEIGADIARSISDLALRTLDRIEALRRAAQTSRGN